MSKAAGKRERPPLEEEKEKLNQIYRRGRLGRSLVATVEEFLQSEEPELDMATAEGIFHVFDQSMEQCFQEQKQLMPEGNITADLRSFNNCMDKWVLDLTNSQVAIHDKGTTTLLASDAQILVNIT